MLVEQANGEYTDFRIPGIIVTEKDSIIRYCECRRSLSDWADIDIKVCRSADGGKSWETVLLIESGGYTLNNPVMFVYGERLILLYCKNYKEIWKRVSTDDGKSFGEPARVNFESNISFFYNVVAVGPGHGIVHRGRMIVPVWFAYNERDEKSHHPSFISTLFSDDAGRTWQVGEPIFKDTLVNPSECALAITAKDEILISIRHEGAQRTRALAKSATAVSGWYDLRFEERLPDPVCMGGMTQRNGLIYHSNCACATARASLTVKISENEFESCREILISEAGGYSDVALLKDKVCVFYEKCLAGRVALFFEAIDA